MKVEVKVVPADRMSNMMNRSDVAAYSAAYLMRESDPLIISALATYVSGLGMDVSITVKETANEQIMEEVRKGCGNKTD